MRSLAPFAFGVALLHLAGWGLFAWYSRSEPALAGLGTLAYTFGLRHAFDADHIAAIDNTARKLLGQGGRPVGVGFYFSLGHSAVVFALTTALALAAGPVAAAIPTMQHAGGIVGASVSGSFLLLIGVLNLLVLADIVRMLRHARTGRLDWERFDSRLLERGVFSRLALKRIANRLDASWKMIPLGAVFGLGFDTASEIGVLAVAAGVATHHVPLLAILALPSLFAAGMSLLDTADGAFMAHAYGWALSSPVRRIYYNLTVTSLSVLVALGIGTLELLQVTVGIKSPDLGKIGALVALLFVGAASISLLYWKVRVLRSNE
jgi:high-affinity nickel-transport protein